MAKKQIAPKRPTRKQEFREHRTSWKWFERRFEKVLGINDRMDGDKAFFGRLLIEILKELQYANDRK